MLLSIITPVYNERKTIGELVRRVEKVNFGNTKTELIIVDDGSTDGTRNILRKMQRRHNVLSHNKNQGKGAAIRTGLTVAKGDVIVVQDADLEYDPNDLKVLLKEIAIGKYDVVYGSRVLGKKRMRYSTLLFHFGGSIITWWANFLFGTHLTDEATCYKMFNRRILKDVTLESKRFEFCPELTGKAINAGYKIKEVPVSYHPRSAKEGKKIRLRDGLEGLWTLTKVKLFNHL
jgi:dolichol-phosphate mannosyltransferase